ncbi:hypothetical protein OHR68_37725 [Spirillospora sp. NBC_00431]
MSVSVIAPVVAAFAVTAAPANATTGPSTTLLYDTATAAAPVTRTLPDSVVQTAGQTAELATGAVDETLKVAPVSPGLRSARSTTAGRCALNPGKTVKSHTGMSLPKTPLSSAAKGPLSGLPQGDCLQAGRRAGKDPLPLSPEGATKVPAVLLKDAGKVGGAVRKSQLGKLPAVGAAVPGKRRAGAPGAERAGMPLSMDLRDVSAPLGSGSAPGLSDITSALGSARPGDLPVGPTLFPPAGRQARPGPSDDLVGKANNTVNQVGGHIDQTENGVGSVVEVLKTKKRGSAKPAGRAAKPADGPLSLLDTPGIGLPDTSGIGLPKAPGLG